MPGTISFDGLASGLNITEIVDKLIEVESRPKILKEAEKARYENQLEAWQELNTKLLTLREEARDLWRSSTWNTLTATSSDSTVLTATTSSSATPGTYILQVTQLAQKHMIASEAFTSTSDTVGTGNLVITVNGASTTIALDGSQTLSDLANAINSQTDVDVSASIVNDGTGYRLVLTSDNSGASYAISLQRDAGVTIFDDSTLGQSNGAPTPAYYDELQAAQDASIQFGSGADAMTITSSSNTITGVIEGVTLNLLSASPGTDITLTISRDSSGMEDQIQAFVDAYNEVWDFIQQSTAYDEDTETRGVLMGDLTVSSIKYRLQSIIGSSVDTGGTYKTLRSIGITMDDEGYLEFDSSDFSDAVQTDYDSVENIFRATNGISEQLSDYLWDLTMPFGTIDNREDALETIIDRLDERISEMEERLEQRRESLLEQFYRMESAISSFNNQSASLANTLSGLSKNWKWNA